MGITDPALLATPAAGVPTITPSPPLTAAMLEIAAVLDVDGVDAALFRAVQSLVTVDGLSLWVSTGDDLQPRSAAGLDADLLTGQVRSDAEQLGDPFDGETATVITVAPLRFADPGTPYLRLTREATGAGPFAPADLAAVRQLALAAGVALRNAEHIASNDRTRDLALVMEMSREVASTLNLDRVMRAVVNLAMRALPFDRGALALYERGACDIRAVAGAENIDPTDPELQDLAVRAAWAAGVGEPFYLSDRTEPASDAERLFLQIFGDDLAADGVASGLYLPLKDDEGVVGILVLEAARPDFATARQQELAMILAHQATVAVRNAQLYHQVPLADALGALHARQEAFLALPRRRRLAIAVAVLAAVALLTLVRWPLRVDARVPVFRPVARAEIRPLTDGVIERVFVREGMTVDRGAPLVQLRDANLRAARDAALAGVRSAERAAAMAAANGDAAEERLQRIRAEVLQREADVRDEELRAATVRAPAPGVVLTTRPEERVGEWADAGSPLLLLGRTDTLELEFLVDQRDIGRVAVGEVVRLRVDAYPQRTFEGRVSAMADVATDSAGRVALPVRALVPNVGQALRPGMVAYARVLTAPASIVGRLTREPARRLRLLWWRMWS